MLRRLALFAAALVGLTPATAADLRDLGVVYLHGKGVWAGAFDGGILRALEADGARIATPEMPWSFRRAYDASYEQAMAEIDSAVAGLRARGARRIVVIGHSLGANAAIGYAARHGPLAAVIAIAPGHLPEAGGLRARAAEAVAEAKQLVAAGQGNVRRRFPDRVQGIPTFAWATPAIYLSLFDPDGPAVMPRNAAAMPPIPFLWVVGRFDPIRSLGPAYAYKAGAKHPASRYIEVVAEHLTTALSARGKIVAWIESL